MRHGRALFALLVFLAMGLRAGEAAPEMSELDKKVAAVLPQPGEDRWLEVPWRTNLMEARAEADAQKKPLFLWIMNGHPLGCT